jgi:hypothetical protein
MATLYLAQGDLETAFIQLTEAHAWVSRLAPRHPDHQTRLKEEERRSLAFVSANFRETCSLKC